MEVGHRVDVAADPAAVWDVLGDPSLMPEWFRKLQNFDALKGDGTKKGDRYSVEYARDNDGPLLLTVDVVKVDAPHGHLHRFEGFQVPFTINSAIEEDGDGSIWDATIEVKLSLVQRALGPVIKNYLDGLAREMGEGFKEYVENN